MLWIRECSEDIPQELYYDDYQMDKDKDGNTPLMMWIMARHNEDIPQELLYPGWQCDRNKNHETPLIFWIDCRGLPIPSELMYPGW